MLMKKEINLLREENSKLNLRISENEGAALTEHIGALIFRFFDSFLAEYYNFYITAIDKRPRFI